MSEHDPHHPLVRSLKGCGHGVLFTDYCRCLALWFASRLDARHVIRRWFGEQRKSK